MTDRIDRFVLPATVTYADVDGQERLLLSGMFKLLQEAAILHANQFGTGTNAVTTRAESWVLNRIAVQLEHYPCAGDRLQIDTWSCGIKGFKGYRDFRVHDASNHTILTGSSLWLYISLATQSLVRVPREVADLFPTGKEVPAVPDLDRLSLEQPADDARAVPVTLRYSDFDVNQHVNNTAFVDVAQTAMVRCGFTPRPRRLALKFAKAIPLHTEEVTVRVERAGETARFSIERDGTVFAHGEASE